MHAAGLIRVLLRSRDLDIEELLLNYILLNADGMMVLLGLVLPSSVLEEAKEAAKKALESPTAVEPRPRKTKAAAVALQPKVEGKASSPHLLSPIPDEP